MKYVLVVYYSQSGEVRRAVESLMRPLMGAEDFDVQIVELQPRVPFPFPWRRITAFFGVMPDTVLAGHGPNLSLSLISGPESRSANLVVLAYPVWFLMPAPPVQRFLADDARRLVQQTPVVALCVCRGMWYHAALTVKRALQQLPCPRLLHIVVTHQGPQWATLLSVPRQLLFGSQRRLLPGLPPPGIATTDFSRLTNIGESLRNALRDAPPGGIPHPSDALPAGQYKVILPELFAWPYFFGSAVVIRCLGRYCRWLYQPATVLFAALLVLLIVIGLPVLWIASKLGHALFPNWFERQTRKVSI